MDGMQAITSKTNLAATNAGAASNDDSAAGAFGALLELVGVRFKGDTGLSLDTKILRGTDPAEERGEDSRDAVRDTAREAAKVRDEQNEDESTRSREAEAKNNREDDADAESAEPNARDDAPASDTSAENSPASSGQDPAAAEALAAAPTEISMLAIEALAPALLAQQVEIPVGPAVVQKVAAALVDGPADADALGGEVAPSQATGNTLVERGAGDEALAGADGTETVQGMTTTATAKAATAEAPIAALKVGAGDVGAIRQVAVDAVAPQQSAAPDANLKSTTLASNESAALAAKDAAQAILVTQRSVAAQQQAQELTRQVGNDAKVHLQVTVVNHAGPQLLAAGSVYDIYSGYTGAQATTANGQAGLADAGNALGGESTAPAAKTPAEAAMARVALAAPALTPQLQVQSAQQGALPPAVRADAGLPAPAVTAAAGGQSSAGFADSGFTGAGANSGAGANGAASTTTSAAAAERPFATAQHVIDQIKVNITRAAKAGMDRVTIQLKPQDLGRIEVRLEMSEDHKVRVTVTADNKDTLALLQNDARTLERALNEAGLRTDANNLHFGLRSESEAKTAGDDNGSGKNAAATDDGASDDEDDVAMTYDYAEAARVRGGIDTFA